MHICHELMETVQEGPLSARLFGYQIVESQRLCCPHLLVGLESAVGRQDHQVWCLERILGLHQGQRWGCGPRSALRLD